MKILFVSMPSIHAVRWIENLKESGHELYWFDITGKGKIQTLEEVTQITNWKKRKLPYIKGEYWLSKKFPKSSLNIVNIPMRLFSFLSHSSKKLHLQHSRQFFSLHSFFIFIFLNIIF